MPTATIIWFFLSPVLILVLAALLIRYGPQDEEP